MPYPNGDPVVDDLYREIAKLEGQTPNLQPDSVMAMAAIIQAKALIVCAEALTAMQDALEGATA